MKGSAFKYDWLGLVMGLLFRVLRFIFEALMMIDHVYFSSIGLWSSFLDYLHFLYLVKIAIFWGMLCLKTSFVFMELFMKSWTVLFEFRYLLFI